VALQASRDGGTFSLTGAARGNRGRMHQLANTLAGPRRDDLPGNGDRARCYSVTKENRTQGPVGDSRPGKGAGAFRGMGSNTTRV
jgi:hypothetical protein